MGNYRLTDEAEADLIRIHQWSVRTHGEAQADRYFAAFFERFDELAEQPLLYPAVVMIFAKAIVGACAALTAFIIASRTKR